MQVPMFERVSFSGHETFPFRYSWLPKAVAAVSEASAAFASDDAMVALGVGKNMVRAIRHWGLVTGILEEGKAPAGERLRPLQVSEFGQRLLGDAGWDPFLEDPATPWLLHWKISSRPERATTWYWVFNCLPQPEFSAQDLVTWLTRLVEELPTARASAASIERDVDCFIRTYVPSRPSRNACVEDSLDCPLVELELLREINTKGSYLLCRSDQRTLPDEVFAFALATLIAHRPHTTATVSLADIAFAPGSPGTVFCLSEEGLMARLERLSTVTSGDLYFDETAGLRQIIIRKAPKPLDILDNYFRREASRSSRLLSIR